MSSVEKEGKLSKGKSLNQVFRYLSFRWNIPKDRITLRQYRQPLEMIRSCEEWAYEKVYSFNYPNEFRVQDIRTSDESTIVLHYQISPCKI